MEQKSDTAVAPSGLDRGFFIDPASPEMNKWDRANTLRGVEAAFSEYVEAIGGEIPDDVFSRMVSVAESFGQRRIPDGAGDSNLTGLTLRESFDIDERRAERENDNPERALMVAQLNAFLSNPTIIKDPRAQAVLERIASFRDRHPLYYHMYTQVVSSQRTSDGVWLQTWGPKPGITREEHLPVFERYLAQVKYEGIYPNFPGAYIDSVKEVVQALKQ